MEAGYTNMLIIGNGFDLAHERPTRYSDFLLFLELILKMWNCNTGDRTDVEEYLDADYQYLCPIVREYLFSALDTKYISDNGCIKSTNNLIQELYDRLDKNVWYEYFKAIQQNDLINGENWIDFEKEILEVINFFDNKITNIYDSISRLQSDSINEKIDLFWTLFSTKIRKEKVQKCTWTDFVDKTYKDLQDLVRCLEIYLDDCVSKMPISCCSPDLRRIEVDSILSFNYTEIPSDVYSSWKNIHHIHGCAKITRSAEENNMVLGVNEYWDTEEKDFRTNFNLYKKFAQRIIKETGIGYKYELEKMLSKHEKLKHLHSATNGYIGVRYTNVIIFGHSLDVTDGDILREVILTPGVATTIYYNDKQQQANQIANLSKVLGQDELLKRVFSTSPTIIFAQQEKMVPWQAT